MTYKKKPKKSAKQLAARVAASPKAEKLRELKALAAESDLDPTLLPMLRQALTADEAEELDFLIIRIRRNRKNRR